MGSQGPTLDLASPLAGVPDREADPAVVAIDVGGVGLCAGALVASDVVLTARRCVDILTTDLQCPAVSAQVAGPRSPPTLRILVGDDLGTAVERARGYEILEPDGNALCGADVALILLDATIDDRTALTIRPTAPARGDHLRTVGFDTQQKLVRDHVAVSDTTSTEFFLSEAPCRTGPGSPAIDESSGELVGVLSRSEPTCGTAGHDVSTRLDAAAALIDEALAFGRKGSAAHAQKEKKGAVDMGATCWRGADCAAGVCASFASSEYCSRTCGAHDKCPAHFRCMQSMQGPMACVEA